LVRAIWLYDARVSSSIHPTALIEEGAEVGAGCIIHAHALIGRHCRLEEGVVVHPYAVLGGDPQDLGFKPDTPSGVRIGARTVIREHVTVNRATKPGHETTVGADCFLMTGCHVAHDCRIGDRVVIANAVLLAGHVNIGDRAFLGGGAVIHQFCRIGESVMIGGGGRISSDVPPYCLATERNTLYGLNMVGLRRRAFDRSVLREIKSAFRGVFGSTGNPRELARAALAGGEYTSSEARGFLEFFLEGRRTFARVRRAAEAEDDAAE
jgi:UDP-N-acetylglucosamine acyltransferase